jgi:hypothetical protein
MSSETLVRTRAGRYKVAEVIYSINFRLHNSVRISAVKEKIADEVLLSLSNMSGSCHSALIS